MLSNLKVLARTLTYIWSHPNCQKKQVQSIYRFFEWQIYKRIGYQHLDLELAPGVQLRCYPDSHSASAVLYCGLYDYNEMNFLLRYLRPEDSFLDVGANVGVYTLLAASKITSGSIYSIEALPKNYERLKENIVLNQFERIQTYQLAVSDKEGMIELSLNDGDSTPSILGQNSGHKLIVKTDMLDNILPNGTHLTLAKMDVEGAELLVLKGAKSLLKNPVFVWILEILGTSAIELVDFLNSYGYRLYQYSADANRLYPVTLEQKQGNNVLAIHNDHLDLVTERLSSHPQN